MPRLATRLLAWYAKNKRSMPWRDHPDPYAIWVSEIMLQQTRVETVVPYFQKWMKLFPTIPVLAQARERDVLNAWEGLGYYSRARNLHKAAKIIAEKFNGQLPRNLDDLRSLPGIGRYTVGAIASMAFKMDEPTLDGNLRRVFSRLYDVTEFADSPAGEKILWELAAQNLPTGQAGDYNQALMDLGATICLPKNPKCPNCPIRRFCLASQNETQALRPLLKPKKKTPHYLYVAAVMVRRGRVLLTQRPAEGLLAGMWEFPQARVEAHPQGELAKAINAAYSLTLQKPEALGVVQHAYTHFKATVHAFRCMALSIPKKKNLKWVKLTDLETYPMGKVSREIAKLLAESRPFSLY
ncbi:MAG: A/G-specific adenine glycosylase [Anaerolineales bacterium]|nr:A/G-specific adenine glycosylase [Anaerolineales bacterium]